MCTLSTIIIICFNVMLLPTLAKSDDSGRVEISPLRNLTIEIELEKARKRELMEKIIGDEYTNYH